MDINDLFRNRLQNREVTPPAFVWEKVEAELRARRRKRVFFWLWTGVIATAVCTGSGWVWYRSSVPSTQQTLLVHSAAQDPAPAPDVPAGQNATVPNQKTSRPTDQPKAGFPAAGAPGSPTAAPSAFTTAPLAEHLRHHSAQSPSAEKAPRSHLRLPRPAPAAQVLHDKPSTASKPASSSLFLQKGAADAGLQVFPASDPCAADPIRAAAPLLSPVAYAVPNTEATPAQEDGPQDFRAVSLLPLQKGAYASLLTNLKPTAPPRILRLGKSPRRRNRCYNFQENANVWFLDIYAGPSYDSKLLRSLPDNQPYLAQRRKTESYFFAYNAGVRASVVFNRFYLLRTGLHYDQTTELFRYYDPAYIQVTTVQRPGTTKLDTINIQYGSRASKIYNRFGKIDIPLLAGAELRKGNTGFSFNGGATFNVAFWKRGQMMNADSGRPDWFTPKEERMDVFRKRVGLSLMASAQWFCHLQPRTRIYIEPYFREILRPVTQPDHLVEQRHRIFGVQCGITCILDKKMH